MYKFKIDQLNKEKRSCTATLVEAENLHINGTLTVKTAYRAQEGIIPGQQYPICLQAVRAEVAEGESYLLAGSWIGGTLHATRVDTLTAPAHVG